eukprot:COSAG02_NODE_43687_length_372_cov_1.267399_1_plen_36_part_01
MAPFVAVSALNQRKPPQTDASDDVRWGLRGRDSGCT